MADRLIVQIMGDCGVSEVRPATAADLPRDLVRAGLALHPDWAAKVAGPWEEHGGQNRARMNVGKRGFLVGYVWRWNSMVGSEWCAETMDQTIGNFGTRPEAEAAVDALLATDGWVLGA